MKHMLVPVAALRLDGNPRTNRTADDIEKMARSIEEFGLENPIKVQKCGDVFKVKEGGTRAAAVIRLNWDFVDALAYDEKEYEDERARKADDVARGLVSNVGRKQLDPLDEGRDFSTLVDLGWNVERIARTVAQDVSYVQDRIDVYLQPIAREQFQLRKSIKNLSDAKKLDILIRHFDRVGDRIPHEAGAILAYLDKHGCVNPRMVDDVLIHYKKKNISSNPQEYDAWLVENPDYMRVYCDCYFDESWMSKNEKLFKVAPYAEVREKKRYGKSTAEAVKEKTASVVNRDERPRTRQEILLDCARLLIEQEELGPKQIVSELFGVLAEAEGRVA